MAITLSRSKITGSAAPSTSTEAKLHKVSIDGSTSRPATTQVAERADSYTPERKNETPDISFWERAWNTVKGGVKGSAASATDAGRALYEMGNEGRRKRNEELLAEYTHGLNRAKRDLDSMLETNEAEPGYWKDTEIQSQRGILDDWQRKVDAVNKILGENVNERAVEATAQLADQMQESSQRDIDKAKEGLGAAGQFAVDVGAAGTQLAGDMLANVVAPGAGTVSMGYRAFGSGTQQARQSGAELGKQLAYGGGSAALSVAAEKIANVAKPFSKTFGEGVLDEAIAKATGKLSQSAAGKAALSALSEGGEELVEAILQPVLQRATYDPSAKFDMGEAIYQMAIGMVLGGAGGGVDAVTSRRVGETPQNTPPNPAAQRTAHSEGVDATQSESPAEAPTDPLLKALLGQEKTAPEVETEVTVRSGQSAINERNRERNTLAYTLATSIDQVSDMLPVSRLTGREMNEPGKKPSEQIADFFKRLGNKVFRAGLGDVALNDYGVGGMLNHRPLNRAKMVSLAAVPDVIQNGRQIHYDPNWKGRGYPSYIFAAPVTVGGTPVYVAAVVDQRPDNKFYLSEMVDSEGNYVRIEESPSSNSKNGVTDGAGQASGAGVTAGPEGLSLGASPSAPNVGTEPVAPVDDSTIAQEPDSVKPGTVGAAAAGFQTPGSQGVERTSKLAEHTTPYTGREGEATARTRQEYDELFRYQSQTEEQSMQEAQNMLYLLVEGEPTFLLDYDPESYQAITDSLRLAPAWNGIMTDAAMMIKQELMGRSIDGRGNEDTYVEWLQVMREHATAGGQGTQAWAKWSRTDNNAGQATELEAWEQLEGSSLSEEERREIFGLVIKFDQEIEQAQTEEALTGIILRIADQRGTTQGFTGKQSKRMVYRARKALESMTFAELKQLAYSSAAALTTDQTPTDTGSKLKVIQLLNMLSSPKTAATNLVGNTSFYGIDAMAMRGAAVLDMALSRLTGTRSVAMEGLVGSKQSRADIIKAVQRSLAEVTLDVDMGGDGRYQQGSNRTFKANGMGLFNTGKAADKFIERVLSVLERNMAYALTTTDEGYKGAAQSTAHATQRLVDEGKIKTKNKDYAQEQAEELALRRTFQNDGYISDTLQILHDWLNAIPHLGFGDSGKRVGKNNQRTVHAFGAGDLIAPFTRVAGNLVSTAVDYNPAKAVQGTVEIVDTIRKAKAGDVSPERQAKAVSDVARGLTGTAISLAATALAKEGLLKRAEDEDDEDVAALNQTEGMTGTQINIDAALRWAGGEGSEWRSGDTLVDLSRLEPLNFLLSFGVEMADNENDDILSTVGEVAGDAVSSFASAAGDLPVMGTIGGVAKDVLVYDDPLMQSITEHLGKTAISSVTPNVLAAFAKGWDGKQRSTYSGEGVEDVLLDTLKSRIPGLREQLPTVVNTLGEEKDNPGTLQERLLNAMLNPIGVNQYSQSAVSQEMERVREETGETGFYPSKSIPSKISATKDGKNKTVEMDYAQKQNFQRDRGALTMVTMASLIGTNEYQKADSKTQSELLADAQSYAYQAAKARLMGNEWVDKWVKNTMEAQTATGLDPSVVIVYRDMLSKAKETGTTAEANKQVRQTIMADGSMTASQKAALDDIVISDGVYIPKEVSVDYTNDERFIITQMSDGAQTRWDGIKSRFGMDAATYQKAWSIYQDDGLKAAEKRQQLSALGYNGNALYSALGQKVK